MIYLLLLIVGVAAGHRAGIALAAILFALSYLRG